VKNFSAQIHASMSARFAEINQEAAALMGKTLASDDV